MSGLAFLIVVTVGAVAGIVVANLIRAANDDHERAGLFGRKLRQHHLDVQELAFEIALAEEQAELASFAGVVAELDRVAFAGVPLTHCTASGDPGCWCLAFRDGTTLSVRIADPRNLTRADRLAAREPVVVARVQPGDGAAVIDLVSRCHAPLRVALRA